MQCFHIVLSQSSSQSNSIQSWNKTPSGIPESLNGYVGQPNDNDRGIVLQHKASKEESIDQKKSGFWRTSWSPLCSTRTLNATTLLKWIAVNIKPGSRQYRKANFYASEIILFKVIIWRKWFFEETLPG